ncbi:hypothetical protein J6590_080620 [Homalodisca vitripennis]|nr:hypothetical protein J6590_080620 [Homalodisca vitripennis]
MSGRLNTSLSNHLAGHQWSSLIGPAVSNQENNTHNKTSSNQFKAGVPALSRETGTGEDVTEINAQNPSSWILTADGLYQTKISCHSAKIRGRTTASQLDVCTLSSTLQHCSPSLKPTAGASTM